MSMVDTELSLSISHIARVTGLTRSTVRALIDHYRIPVLRCANLVAVRPESRDLLIRVLMKHPGVPKNINSRL